MNNRHTLLQVFALAAVILGSQAEVNATPVPATVQATPEIDGRLQYQVTNQSDLTASPFDISLFVVSAADGSTNPTINLDIFPNWVVEPLTATSWEQPMGDPAGPLPTWHQYTGMEFLSWTPPSPIVPPNPCFGYFLNYALSGEGLVVTPPQPIHPGVSLGGFFHEVPPEPVMPMSFLVAGPSDASVPFVLGQIESYSGQTLVPEPSSLVLAALGLIGLAAWGWRRKR